MTSNKKQEIRTRSCPDCYICGTQGVMLYQSLRDRLFGAPGRWNLKKCSNPECGLVWLDPMPVPEDLGKLYINYFTHADLPTRDSFIRCVYQRIIDAYLCRRFGYHSLGESLVNKVLGTLLYLHPGRRAEVDASVIGLPAMPSGRLLEVGCGSGTILYRLQSMGWEVEGVDFDPVAVENARSKGLSVRFGELNEQGYPDDTFDVVISNHVIEHVPDPAALIAECHRVLKPGGQIVAYTPNSEALGHRIYKANWRGIEPPRHLHIFNCSVIVKMANSSGFDNCSCTSSCRGAGILLNSHKIYKYGYIEKNRWPSLAQRVINEILCFVEWGICSISQNVGEEIVLIGRKS